MLYDTPRGKPVFKSKNINYIHNIFISEKRIDFSDLPKIVLQNIASVKRHHPKAEYLFWQGQEIREFLRENFPPSVLKCFDRLTAFALKADLARYCILSKKGGLYSDLSNYFVSRLEVAENVELIAFRDRNPMHGSFWMVQNTIIYADSGISEMRMAVDYCVNNIEKRNYGNSSLEPTGPALFGRVLIESARHQNYALGKSVNVGVEVPGNRSHYISADGGLIAIRLQGGGGKPSELGLRGTNTYGELWDRRQLFDENESHYQFDSNEIHSPIGKTEKGIPIRASGKKFVLYGPYIAVYEGSYVAEFCFEDIEARDELEIDVCCLGGKKIVCPPRRVRLNNQNKAILEFRLEEYVPDLEVRLRVGKRFAASFRNLVIRRIGRPDRSMFTNGADTFVKPIPCESRDILYVHHLPDQLGDVSHIVETRVRDLYPSAFYQHWDRNSITTFLRMHYSEEVLRAYEALHGTAFARDLAMYALLNTKGGLVVSGLFDLVSPLQINETARIAAFVDQGDTPDEVLSIRTDLVYSQVEQPEIQVLIDRLIQISAMNASKIDYLVRTGYRTDMLGRALAKCNRTRHYLAGQAVHIGMSKGMRETSFIGTNGSIVAVKKTPFASPNGQSAGKGLPKNHEAGQQGLAERRHSMFEKLIGLFS